MVAPSCSHTPQGQLLPFPFSTPASTTFDPLLREATRHPNHVGVVVTRGHVPIRVRRRLLDFVSYTLGIWPRTGEET
jgi:hypothetical protein